MPLRRIAISEEVYRALQAEGLVTGESPGAILDRLVSGGISTKARGILTTIGQPSATERGKNAISPKRARSSLAKDPEALQTIRDMWQSGEKSRAAIARKIGYPASTTAERIRAMLAAGELSESAEEEEGGEGPG
jgi:negative regulator of replication initiation